MTKTCALRRTCQHWTRAAFCSQTAAPRRQGSSRLLRTSGVPPRDTTSAASRACSVSGRSVDPLQDCSSCRFWLSKVLARGCVKPELSCLRQQLCLASGVLLTYQCAHKYQTS